MIEISRGEDRYGRDGMVQIPKTRGTAVGLNHLAWEMASERELVEAYKRTQPLFDADLWTADHIVAHSMYVPDPDGNLHELYADPHPMPTVIPSILRSAPFRTHCCIPFGSPAPRLEHAIWGA
jgi:hypothetical protein